MSNIEERLLWEKFLSGDDRAYAYIYEKHVQSLFAFGLQYSLDRELVKDCIQDVFIKIYKNRNNLNSTDNIKLYLFIALKNSLLNILKKDQNISQWIDSIDPNNVYERDVENIYIENETDEERQKKVMRMMDILTPRQQKAIHFRFVECMSITEIQELMGMNYQSVQNLIQRALIKIRKNFPEKE